MRSVFARRPVAPLRSESELTLRPARNCPSLPSDCGEISVNTRHRSSLASVLVCATLLTACAGSPRPTPAATTSTQTADTYDLIVRNGTLFDGSGTPGRRADVGIRGDRVASVGDLAGARATTEIDASGKAVAPGFINVLSWANTSLIADGRGMSDLKQGVTLEIMGEGESGGPLNDAMKADILQHQGDIKYEIDWTTLGEYLDSLVRRGISLNVASFVGATSVRVYVLGEDDRDPTPAELARMQDLVRQAMREGALGVGSSLIYAPAFFAETPELIALAHGGCRSGRRLRLARAQRKSSARGCDRRTDRDHPCRRRPR